MGLRNFTIYNINIIKFKKFVRPIWENTQNTYSLTLR